MFNDVYNVWPMLLRNVRAGLLRGIEKVSVDRSLKANQQAARITTSSTPKGCRLGSGSCWKVLSRRYRHKARHIRSSVKSLTRTLPAGENQCSPDRLCYACC